MRSMTGYGTATAESESLSVKVEIKSLNGKALDINMRLPRAIQDLELPIRNKFSKMLERGSVTMQVSFEFTGKAPSLVKINTQLAESYLKELQGLSATLGIEPDNLFKTILGFPEVVKSGELDLKEDDKEFIMATVEAAFQKYDEFRKNEGESLKNELVTYVQNISGSVKSVEELEAQRTEHFRTKILKNIEENIQKDLIDRNRLEQEIIFYLEKLDIAEEKTRLKNHCEYFIQSLKDEQGGKKLNFISQEMGREINTMGAKANFFPIQQLVIGMKEELEKIKEQLLNVV